MEITQYPRYLQGGTVSIEYHADDYGLFPAQSRRILDCADNGVLNAISIMPNSPHLAECMKAFIPYQDRLTAAVHLNFIEGKAFCPGVLSDSTGTFRVSFVPLLLHSFLPDRNKYRSALRKEIRAQIHAVAPYLTEKSLRIDGHAHYHMIPVIFDALMDVIQEEKLPISYIRIPREFVSVYLHHWRELKGFRWINLVKVLVLNTLAWRNTKKYRSFFSSQKRRVFLGVFFSGNMCFQNVSAVLPEAVALAEQKGWGVEIMAHPGGVYERSDIVQLTNQDDISFLTNSLRQKESETFHMLYGG